MNREKDALDFQILCMLTAKSPSLHFIRVTAMGPFAFP